MKPLIDPQDWLSLKEVAYALRLSRHTVVRLSEDFDPVTRQPYLRAWRPSPGTLLISRQSLEAYCDATRRDPEFWVGRKQIQTHVTARPAPLPAVIPAARRHRLPRRERRQRRAGGP
jgi:hypothetical protein